MFKGVKVKTVNDYIDSIDDQSRKEIIVYLHKFIQKSSAKFKPFFAYNMLGYGSFLYKNYKKEMITWPIIALANQKNYISIYMCSVVDGEYIAEKYKKDLGKVSVGKSCIRFKKIDDVNLVTLNKLLKLAAKKPGLSLDK